MCHCGWVNYKLIWSILPMLHHWLSHTISTGPMKKQMGDYGVFWAMVWQQKVEKIVMVTKLKEEGVRTGVTNALLYWVLCQPKHFKWKRVHLTVATIRRPYSFVCVPFSYILQESGPLVFFDILCLLCHITCMCTVWFYRGTNASNTGQAPVRVTCMVE